MTPEEKIAKENRERVATWMMGGVVGVIALLGLGQGALQVAEWRKQANRPKQPWDL